MIVVASIPAYPVPFYREAGLLDCPWCGLVQPERKAGACNECGEVYMVDEILGNLKTHPEAAPLPMNMKSLVLVPRQFRLFWRSIQGRRK